MRPSRSAVLTLAWLVSIPAVGLAEWDLGPRTSTHLHSAGLHPLELRSHARATGAGSVERVGFRSARARHELLARQRSLLRLHPVDSVPRGFRQKAVARSRSTHPGSQRNLAALERYERYAARSERRRLDRARDRERARASGRATGSDALRSNRSVERPGERGVGRDRASRARNRSPLLGYGRRGNGNASRVGVGRVLRGGR